MSYHQSSEEEAFANSYYFFIESLKVLAADADTQCKRMGNFNVAWEIKDDVSAGAYLLNLPNPLTQDERDGITAMVKALDELPSSLLVAAASEAENRKAMNDPRWVPLRLRASELLQLLAATTAWNESIFMGRSS